MAFSGGNVAPEKQC